MRTFFKVIARGFAAFFAIFFVISAVLVLILFNLGNRMFNARLYKNALADLNVYETLPGLVGRLLTLSISYNPCAENPIICEDISPELRTCYKQTFDNERYAALASGQGQPTDDESQAIQACLDQYGGMDTPAEGEGESSGEGGMPPFFRNMTAEDWESILEIVIPPEEMKAMAESVLDGVFAYLDGEVDQVTVSLVTLKRRLSGPAGEDLIIQVITSQPPCSVEELPFVTGESPSESMVLCNPPEDMLPLVRSTLRQQLDEAVSGIPDEAVIIKPVTADTPPAEDGPFGSSPADGIRIFRLILRLSPLLPLIFLLLVTLFGVRSLKDWMRWWGIPLFITGGIGFGTGIGISPILARVWTVYVLPRLPSFLPPDAASLGRDLAGYIAHDMSERIVLQALLLLLIGLAAWIGSHFIKPKAEQEQPPSPVSTPAPPSPS